MTALEFTIQFLEHSGAKVWVPAVVLAWLHGLSRPQPEWAKKNGVGPDKST